MVKNLKEWTTVEGISLNEFFNKENDHCQIYDTVVLILVRHREIMSI